MKIIDDLSTIDLAHIYNESLLWDKMSSESQYNSRIYKLTSDIMTQTNQKILQIQDVAKLVYQELIDREKQVVGEYWFNKEE